MKTQRKFSGLILLILNDDRNLQAFASRLGTFGYDSVETCTDGKAALRKLKSLKPDVVISEVELEGELDGIETGKRIRSEHKLPLIYLSGRKDEATFQRALKIHPLAFLEKPVKWNELRMAVESALFCQREKESTEADLMEYKERFETAPVPCLILDAAGNLIVMNHAWTRMTGYTHDESAGRCFGDFLIPEEKEHFGSDYPDLLAEDGFRELEFRLVHKSGRIVHVSLDGTARQDERGIHSQLHCILKDITNQKRLEERLREEKHLTEAISECPSISIFIYDIQGQRNLWVNNTHRKLLDELMEMDPAEADRDTLLELIHPDDRSKVISALDKLLRSHRDDYSELEYRLSDGRGGWRWFRERKSIFKSDETGNVLQFMGVAIDITETKIARETLETRIRQIRMVNDNMPALIAYLDKDARYRYVNKLHELWYGIPQENIIGKTMEKLIGADAYRKIEDYMNDALAGKTVHFDNLVLQVGGKSRYISGVYIPETDNKGDVTGLFSLITDITESVEMNLQLIEREKQYRSLLESMDGLALSLDRDGVIHTAAGTYLEEPSFQQQNLIGMNISNIIDRDISNQLKVLYEEVLEKGKTLNWENIFRIRNIDRDFVISIYPVREVKEDTERVGMIFRDVTELIRSEKKLQETKRWLYSVLNNAPITIFATDDRGIFTLHEGKGMQRTGMKPGENVGTSAYDLYRNLPFIKHDDKILTGSEVMDRALSGETLSGITWLNNVCFDNNIGPIWDRDGKTIGVVGIATDITERVKAEEELKESEERYRQIFENSPAGIVLTNRNGKFIAVNPAFRRMLGYSEEELRRRTFLDITHPEHRKSDRAGIRDLWAGKINEYRTEKHYISRDGNIISGNVIATVVRADDRQPVYALAVIEDITGRKKAEEALFVSLEKYRVLFESFPLGITITDVHGRILEANSESERILGISRSEHAKRSADSREWKLVRLDGTPMPSDEYASVRALKENRRIANVEMGIVKKNGRITWLDVTAAPIPVKGLGVAITYSDITSRKKTEMELQSSEARFKAFMNNLPVLTYIKNESGKFIFGNRASLKLAGTTMKHFLGSEVSDYLSGELAERMRQMDQNVISTGKAIELPEWRLNGTKGERWFREYKFPIQVSGQELMIGGWMMDITDQKRTDSELKEREALFKDIVEKAGIAIMTDDRDGRINYFNREFARLFGYRMAAMRKQSRETLITGTDLLKLKKFQKLRMKGKSAPDHYELIGIRKNGEQIRIEVKTTLLADKYNYSGTRNYMWDITGRIKSGEMIKNSEIRFRNLFNYMSSGVAIYEYDPARKDFVFIDINRAGMAISGIKRKKDVLGKCLMDCFPGAGQFGLLDVLSRVNRSGRPANLAQTHYHDEKLNLYVENFVYKLKTGEIVAVYDNIKDRVLAERSLLKSIEENKKLTQHLEKIREEERKYIASELHDELGQILTAIKMDVSWIRKRMPHGRTGMKGRAESTLKIIDDAISRIQQLSMELRPKMLDNLGLVETLKAYFSDYEKRTGISVSYILPELEPKLIPGQEISIFRIIQEFLINTTRHARASDVMIRMQAAGDRLILEMNDNGIGITDEQISSSDSLGIMIMKDRVNQWKGELRIKGSPGKGTYLSVELPIQKDR